MPRITEEESNARRTEIVDACETLYRTLSYRDITMAQIAEGLSFGRANIYNYFQCKDEIFLALLQREYELWASDLAALRDGRDALDDDGIARGLAASLQAREQMLRLMAMNLYEMEENSRLENLIAFKRVYRAAVDNLRGMLEKYKPRWDGEHIDRFLYSFLPFMYGVYPYAHATDKQLAAIEAAGAPTPGLSIFELADRFVRKMVSDD